MLPFPLVYGQFMQRWIVYWSGFLSLGKVPDTHNKEEESLGSWFQEVESVAASLQGRNIMVERHSQARMLSSQEASREQYQRGRDQGPDMVPKATTPGSTQTRL